jgi:amino acid transporter
MPSLVRSVTRLIQGPPIPWKHARRERLSVLFALPTFASDALSSVAYATEQILLVLLVAGSMTAAHFHWVIPISVGIGILLFIVATSYRQTIMAYPEGGGSYTVTSDNLGSLAGRVAGASLLIGYVLTVAVSEAAAVAAIVSAFPALYPFRAHLATGLILLIAFVNLRGIKESGIVFALPTYAFIVCILSLVFLGLWRGFVTGIGVAAPSAGVGDAAAASALLPLGLFGLLHAFSAGCTALTGVEAIANGVPAFRPPEAPNASRTLLILSVICVTMFIGIGIVAFRLHVVPAPEGVHGYETILSMIARGLVGKNWFYFAVQAATTVILILAANTAFADFPRLCSFIARDGYLPTQLSNLGDRLVFHWGIILLAATSIALIYLFQGETTSLLPLYAGSVFIAFSLNQFSMVRRWHRQGRNTGRLLLNLVGAVSTTIVGVVFIVTRFVEGAWLVPVIGSLILVGFTAIRRHYEYHAQQLAPEGDWVPETPLSTVIVLVPGVHRGIMPAINYAKSIGPDCRAVHVSTQPTKLAVIRREWERFDFGVPLVVLASPYRALVEPILEYVDEALREKPDKWLTVVIPEAVPSKWWQKFLHNNSAFPIRLALASRKRVVIANVRYHLA